MVPFSGGGRSAHVATNMSNHMMRSITTLFTKDNT